MKSRFVATFSALVVCASACTFVATFNDRPQGVDAGVVTTQDAQAIDSSVDAHVAVDASVDATSALDAGIDAPNPCPPGMSPVAAIGGPTYCIDSTEVTFHEYQDFINAGVAPSTQITICSFNTTFNVKSNDGGSCPSTFFQPENDPTFPIGCINWCDATAYCAWAGKHLCGGVNADGGPADFANSGNPLSDEWYNACSAGGANAYPYGDTFDNSSCNTDALGPVDVATFAECTGGYPGIFDMSGNVQEWEDSCQSFDPANFNDGEHGCFIRGGAYWFNADAGIGAGLGPSALACKAGQFPPPGAFSNDWGFRCCK